MKAAVTAMGWGRVASRALMAVGSVWRAEGPDADQGGRLGRGQAQGHGQVAPGPDGEIRPEGRGQAAVLLFVDGEEAGGAHQFRQMAVGRGDNDQGPAGLKQAVEFGAVAGGEHVEDERHRAGPGSWNGCQVSQPMAPMPGRPWAARRSAGTETSMARPTAPAPPPAPRRSPPSTAAR